MMAEDFFSGVQQTESNVADIDIKKPLFWKDSRIFGALFPAPLGKLREILPEPLVPAQVLPGTGIFQLNVYENHDTDLGPFNEFVAFIALWSPRFSKVAGYNFLRALASHELYYYIVHMAGSSEKVVRVFNQHLLFPAMQASIEFSDDDDWLTCEAREQGNLIFRLRGRKIKAKKSDINRLYFYTPLHQQTQLIEANFKRYTISFKPSNAELTVGQSHPIARELSEILKSTRPLTVAYIPSFQAIAYGPGGSPQR
jgi:hypothetical protein